MSHISLKYQVGFGNGPSENVSRIENAVVTEKFHEKC